jgi:hypothetical protein
MNPSTKEIVDAAVERVIRVFMNTNASDVPEELARELTSITEKAVASERARIREGVEGMKKKLVPHAKGCPNTLNARKLCDCGRVLHEDINAALDAVLPLLNHDAEAKKHLNDLLNDPAHIRKAAEQGAEDQNAMLTPKTSCCQWCDPESDTQQRGCKKCPCHNKLADTDI